MVGVGLVLFGILVVGLIALRPIEGETAAGTERLPLTTTTELPDTSSSITSTNSEAPVSPDQAAFFRSDVARGQTGFLALLRTGSVGAQPALYRSDDGASWDRVEADIPDISEPGIDFVEYSDLISAGQNFAVLRTGSSNEGQGPRRIVRTTERLVSTDGERWTLDEAFTVVQHQSPAFPSFHLANSFGFSTNGEVEESTSGLDCEALLSDSAGPFANSLLIHRFGRVEPTLAQTSFAVAHTQLPGARIASFAFNGIGVDPLDSCGLFPGDVPEFPPAAIEIVAADDSVRRIPLPTAVIEAGDLPDWPNPSLFGTEEGLLVLLRRSIWNLDVETEEWTWLLDLPAEASSIMDYQIVDGRYVVGLADSVVIRADLELGEVATNVISRRSNPAAGILYADSEVIIAPSLDPDQATTRLPLPTSFFPEPEG